MLFRSIGIGLSGLDEAGAGDPTDLLEPRIARKAAAERAMDKVRTRFGRDAVVRGQLYRQKRQDTQSNPNQTKQSDRQPANPAKNKDPR